MAAPQLTDEQFFGQSQAPAYGPGAPESGQPATPAQLDWLRRNASAINNAATVGSEQRPSFDTPTTHGDSTIYHVDEHGQLFDPAQDAARASGVAPAKTVSDAEFFGSDFTPGVGYDRRPTSQSLGAAEGGFTVGKNVTSALTGDLPTAPPAIDKLNLMMHPLALAGRLGLGMLRGQLDKAETTQRPGELGKVGTETLLTLPLAAMGEGAPLIVGGMQGALTSEAKTPGGRLLDIGAGAAGAKLGDLAMGAAKNVVWPTIRPEAQWAMDNGIRLTPGQIGGGVVKKGEDMASHLALAGPLVRGAQRQSLADANLSAVNNALTAADLKPLEGVPAGTRAIDRAHQAFSESYNAIVPKLTIVRDPALDTDIAEITASAAGLEPALASRYQKLVDQVYGGFDATGAMAGPKMRTLDERMGLDVRRFGKSEDPFHQEYADAVSDLQEILRSATERSNPAFAKQLSGLNSGYAQMVRLDKAAVLAKQNGGIWTPDQLMQAVTTRGMDNSARQTSSARGRALLQDWANSAKDVLPSTIPKNGNALENLFEGAVTLGVGKEAGLHYVAPAIAAELGLTAAYSPMGRTAMRAAMTQRPAVAKPISEVIQRLGPYAGLAGSIGATKGLLPWAQPTLAETLAPLLTYSAPQAQGAYPR